MTAFALLEWFRLHRRVLPWRTPDGTRRDPWATLVSEVMSQQTRLEVVIDRFHQWRTRFPTPTDLAQAGEEEVLAAWAGLGYYSRARNLHKTAQALSQKGVPGDYAGWLELPGVGPYTAAAVASLCLGEAVPAIDGNMIRVLSRLHALEGDPRSGTGKKRLQGLARKWVSQADPGAMNEATMELGALVCTPRAPRCHACPLATECRACALGEPERFPPARGRRETVRLRETALLLRDARGRVALRRAGVGELLQGLWTLPLRDERGEAPHGQELSPVSGEVRHSITHHSIRWQVEQGELSAGTLPPDWCLAEPADLPTLVVSSLPRKALELGGLWPATEKTVKTRTSPAPIAT